MTWDNIILVFKYETQKSFLKQGTKVQPVINFLAKSNARQLRNIQSL